MSILSVQDISKRYKFREVVKGISLEITSGEVVGLLGPNGAGKTTAFYMIVGLIASDRGQILLDGQDLTSLPMHRRAALGLGYLPQEASIFRKLTVEQNILAILENRRGTGPCGTRTGTRSTARRVACRPRSNQSWYQSVRRRKATRGNCQGAGSQSALRPSRRTIRRRRPDLRTRYSKNNQTLMRSRDRRSDY